MTLADTILSKPIVIAVPPAVNLLTAGVKASVQTDIKQVILFNPDAC